MRFALSTAGLATVSFSGMAMAGTINITDQVDRWAGEHYWQMYDSASNMVASASQLSYNNHIGSFDYWSYTTNTASSIWGSVFMGMTLANGTYNVQMQDSYGDGWAWGSFVGGVYVTGDVSAAAGASLPSGSTASFSFTVVPAPGAMALLGLAGLAARRRRRG